MKIDPTPTSFSEILSHQKMDRGMEMAADCVDMLVDAHQYNLMTEVLYQAADALDVPMDKFRDAIASGYYEWVK